MKRRHTSPDERLKKYSQPGPPSVLGTDCIQWTGYVRPDGYGDVSIQGKLVRPHRLAYTLAFGNIQDGMDIDHECHNVSDCKGGLDCTHRRCINPAHLREVPRATNARAGRTGESLNGVLGSHCQNGHEMTEANTIRAFGRRWCDACKRARAERMRWPAYLDD